jgi:hypothetical protein
MAGQEGKFPISPLWQPVTLGQECRKRGNKQLGKTRLRWSGNYNYLCSDSLPPKITHKWEPNTIS